MAPRIRRQPFLPSYVGLSRVAIDTQGRVVVPSDLRAVFRGRKLPIRVTFTLSARGKAVISPSDTCPSGTEREVLDPTLELARRADPRRLPADHLQSVQDFFRVLACRFLDGEILAKWQLSLPAAVRSWLGLGLIQSNPAKSGTPSGQRRQRKIRGTLGTAIVVGNFGALEIWNETDFRESVTESARNFDSLITQAATGLRHALTRP